MIFNSKLKVLQELQTKNTIFLCRKSRKEQSTHHRKRWCTNSLHISITGSRKHATWLAFITFICSC